MAELRTTVAGSWWPLPDLEGELRRYHGGELSEAEAEDVLRRAASEGIRQQRELGLTEWTGGEYFTYLTVASEGKAKVLSIRDDEFPETEFTADQLGKDLASLCKECEIVEEIDFTLALASQRLASKVTQALRNNRDIDYITTPFDTVNVFVQQGIAAAGRKGKVKIVGVGGDPPSVDAIMAGDEVASLGTSAEWLGWMLVDGLVRSFAGQEVPPLNKEIDTNYDVPQRFITADTELDPQGWQGGFDYQSKFKELWGK